MTSRKELLRSESGVELWRIGHPSDPAVAGFFVKDPRRTPEDWAFGSLPAAEAKFRERLENAKTQPPLR